MKTSGWAGVRHLLAGIGWVFGLAVGGLILVLSLVFAPFAIRSAYEEIASNSSDAYAVDLTPIPRGAAAYSRVSIMLMKLDEVSGIATLRVSGYHACRAACAGSHDRLVFSTFEKRPDSDKTQPPTTAIDLPIGAEEISAKFDLPIGGRVMLFPFDTYDLRVGIAVERIFPDGSRRFLEPDSTDGSLSVSFDEDVSRLSATEPVLLDPIANSPPRAPYRYVVAFKTELNRPLYLKYTVMLMSVLIIIAAIYTVLLNRFSQLILTTGTIIFGIWSARTLLIGGFPPDVTLLDLCLSVTVIAVLLATAGRSIGYFYGRHRSHGLENTTKSE